VIISPDFNELDIIIIQASHLSLARYVTGFMTKEFTFNKAEG
jgi:hypothetical protein